MEYTKERLLEALLRNIYPCEIHDDGQIVTVKLNVSVSNYIDKYKRMVDSKTLEEDFAILVDVAIKSGKGEPIFDE